MRLLVRLCGASTFRYRHRGRDRTNSNPARPVLGECLLRDALPEKIEIPMSVWLVDADNPRERAGRRLDLRCREGRFAMMWFYCLMVALGTAEKDAAEATDWMKPATWQGNFWGPAATRARSTGELPPLPTNPVMTHWATWGKRMLRDGDIVFRLGDAKALGGTFPLSQFIATATGSRFSHTGIVAVESGSPVVYDCSSAGVQRQPFEVWMLDCVGAVGVKRLKPEYRNHIPGILSYCRTKFEQQVPFDFEFRAGRCSVLLCRAYGKSVSV